MAEKIRPVETDFTEKGFRYTQIAREGEWAVYHKTKESGSYFSNEYEVVRIKQARLHPKDPNPEGWDKREAYPASRRWGRHGFTILGREEALARMRSKAQGGGKRVKKGASQDKPAPAKSSRRPKAWAKSKAPKRR